MFGNILDPCLTIVALIGSSKGSTKLFWGSLGPFGPPRGYPKDMKGCQKVLYHWAHPVRVFYAVFRHFLGALGVKVLLLPVRVCFRPKEPLWGPRGHLKGPRVGQHDLLSCILPV